MIHTTYRSATKDELAKELDRRGAVIEKLEARIAELEAALAAERQKREFAEYREQQAEITMTEALMARADEAERKDGGR